MSCFVAWQSFSLDFLRCHESSRKHSGCLTSFPECTLLLCSVFKAPAVSGINQPLIRQQDWKARGVGGVRRSGDGKHCLGEIFHQQQQLSSR